MSGVPSLIKVISHLLQLGITFVITTCISHNASTCTVNFDSSCTMQGQCDSVNTQINKGAQLKMLFRPEKIHKILILGNINNK